MPDMWDRPEPGTGCGCGAFLWCRTAVIAAVLVGTVIVAWLVER